MKRMMSGLARWWKIAIWEDFDPPQPEPLFERPWRRALIQKFTASGAFVTKWGTEGSGDGQLNRPVGVAVAPDGSVYVADTVNNRIQKFTASGAFVTKWGTEGSGDSQFKYPFGVAVAPDGSVYVADKSNHRIQKFTASGAFVTKWGRFGSGDVQFRSPAAVAVAPDGSVYVADSGNCRIQKFTASGAFVTKRGTPGSGDGQLGFVQDQIKFSDPSGVAVAPDGSVYVADYSNHRIQKFTASGAFLTKWGRFGSGDGQFDMPRRVAVAPDGSVYVADSGNDRIQKFTASGAFVTKWGTQGSGDGQFPEWFKGSRTAGGICGVAVAPDGSVYVTDLYARRKGQTN